MKIIKWIVAGSVIVFVCAMFTTLTIFLLGTIGLYLNSVSLPTLPRWAVVLIGCLGLIPLHLFFEDNSNYHIWRNKWIHHSMTENFPVTPGKAFWFDLVSNFSGQLILGAAGFLNSIAWVALAFWVLLDVSIHVHNEFWIAGGSPAFKSSFPLLLFGIYLLAVTWGQVSAPAFIGAGLIGLWPLGGNLLWERKRAEEATS